MSEEKQKGIKLLVGDPSRLNTATKALIEEYGDTAEITISNNDTLPKEPVELPTLKVPMNHAPALPLTRRQRRKQKRNN